MNEPLTRAQQQELSIGHVAFEAYHLRLFSHLCKNALKEKWRREADVNAASGQYPRFFYDHAFEYTFYIHLRVLFYFFYMPPKKGMDDVTLSYFVNPRRLQLQPVLPNERRIVKDHLSKRLAHLTESRRDRQPVDPIIGDALKYYLDYGDKVMSNLLEFEKALPDNLKAVYQSRIESFLHRDRHFRQFLDTHPYFGIAPTLDISQPGGPLTLPSKPPHS